VMWLATGHYWPHFPVDCEGVVGPSEVDCCMVCGVCRCLVNCIAVCSPASVEVAQRAKKDGHNSYEKNTKKNKTNPDNNDTSPPSLTKSSHAPCHTPK